MLTEELRQLIAKGESETLELKTSIPRPDVIANHLASMANTSGGTLVLGVREPAVATGVDIPRARQAIARAATLMSPSTEVSIEEHDIDGKSVLSIHVPASHDLVAAGGGYYRRVGDAAQPLTAMEIRRHLVDANPTDEALKKLSEAVATQTATIDKLRADFDRVNSPWKKIGIAVVGAAVGALLKYVLDWYQRASA